MKNNKENKYYVYEHIRLDNNTCFYVGKGCGDRYKKTLRNPLHDEIAKKYGMKSIIVMDNLTEAEAIQFEQALIWHYVFTLDYGIDIIGYKKDGEHFLTNRSLGDTSYGSVHTEEWKQNHSISMSGSNNPMYGINLWDTYTEDKKIKIRNRLSELNSGDNNHMYGISPKNRMSESVYNGWLEKCKQKVGDKNPNYGNHTLHNKLKDNPELRLQYYSRKGLQNGRATTIHLYQNGEYIMSFDYIKLCAEWIKNKLNLSTSISTIQGAISTSVKTNKPYRGFSFKYEK